MTKKFKTTFNAFLVGQYECEPDYYNKMSEKGWQLISAGCFHQKFRYDKNARYRYKFDFRKKPDDFARYLETFREQGWEYVSSTFTGWHAFRKPWVPALPESEYEIYTDKESSKEMRKRTAGVVLAVGIISVIGFIFSSVYAALFFGLPSALLCLGFAILLYLSVVNILSVNGKKLRVKSYTWLIIIQLVFLAGSGVLSEFRPDGFSMYAEYMELRDAKIDGDACAWFVKIDYPDFYYFDFEINSDAPATLTFVDYKSGKIVYTVRGNDVREKRVRQWLIPGEYRIYFTDFAGGEVSIDCYIH